MRDNVQLLIIGKKVSNIFENFVSYRISSNLFQAADAFEFSLGPINSPIAVEEGDRCRLIVNGFPALTGIIDQIIEIYDKSGTHLTIKGRDLMGILVDSYVENFECRQDEKLESLAERLLANVDFIELKDIRIGEESKDQGVLLTKRLEEFEYTEVEPYRTIFDVLKSYALARGLLFFAMPDGTFVFDKPVTSGMAIFTLTLRKNDQNNNILEGERVRDISKRYKKVTVIGQRQGQDIWDIEDINFSEPIEDKSFPFKKTFVANLDVDGQDPKQYARILMEKQQFDSFQLGYKTYGHSQHGRNFRTNAICHVEDEFLGISGDFLIYSRIFERSKGGSFTNLQLSKLGILPV